MNLLHLLLSGMKAGHTSRTILSVFQKTVNIWPIKFCTCFVLYQEDILVSAICMHCPLRKKQKSKLFVADMPAPYRRGRLKKRNLISSIKKRFTGGRAAAKQNAILCNTLAKHFVLCNFSKGNHVVVGTRSLSSGLDPNEKSQGYLSNTNGDSRHTSNILDSSQQVNIPNEYICLLIQTSWLLRQIFGLVEMTIYFIFWCST